MIGFELGPAALGAIEQSVGVSAALVVADKVVSRGSSDGRLAAAFEQARTVAEGQSRSVEAGGRYLVRVTRTSDSAAAARVVWLVARHQQAPLFRAVPQMLWMPALAVLALAALSIVWSRR
jgi:hypothetical protein